MQSQIVTNKTDRLVNLQTALNKVFRYILEYSDFEALIQDIIRTIAAHLHYRAIYLYIYDKNQQGLIFNHCYDPDNIIRCTRDAKIIDKECTGFLKKSIEDNRPILIQDMKDAERGDSQCLIRSFIAVPYQIPKGIVFIICAEDTESNKFDEEDLDFLEHTIKTVAISFEKDIMLSELRKKNKELAEANRLKDEFVAHVSHEFRTPLAIIKGFVDTMRQKRNISQEERERFLRIICEEIERLSQMIEDLLDVAKIEAGYILLNKKDVDISEIINKSIGLFKHRAQAKKIKIISRYESNKSICHIDPSRIMDVINNLLSNAINYTEGGNNIRIRLFKSMIDRRPYNVFEVFNPGRGIPEDKIDKIFEKFYRVKYRDSYIKGSGLGLYIAKKIVEMHNGMIKVRSLPEEGTTFSIYLPAVEMG